MFAQDPPPSGASMLAAHGITGLLAGRYAIERMLGEGATATVHLARDTHAGISVAIKLLRPELAESGAAKRFLKEIQRTSSLDHPRILKVLDAGEHDGRPYFVLPYMEGGTLRQRLKRQPQLPIEEAIAIARSVAESLDYAHSHGLIHKDVKPENILFTGGEACLGDFGIARALEHVYGEASSSAHMIRGTPAYMSPEQAAGAQDLDGRSDQYSLACVVYEMITGMPAFVGPTPESIIAQRFTHGPREVRAYRPTTPSQAERALLRGLALEPADRYASCGALTAGLEASVVTGPATDAVVQPIKARKHAILAGAGGGIAALAIAVIWASGGPRTLFLAPVLDTTRVLVVPFTSDSGPIGSHLLHDALRRWNGISVVSMDEVAAQTAERGDRELGPSQANALAESFGAGRYVISRVLRTPSGRALSSEFRDVRVGMLHGLQVPLPSDPARLSEAIASVADALLLRGKTDGSPYRADQGTRNLRATQLAILGFEARDRWSLAEAESLFAAAVEGDQDYARAHLWLAQVRSWRGQSRTRWVTSAERASSDTLALNPWERLMARGLTALGNAEYVTACSAYDQLAREEPRSFEAWYGMGECRRRDNIVVPDSKSSTGWRFRASFDRAIQAYTRAFELLPASYQGFEDAAYSRLRDLLFISARSIRTGYRLGASRPEFYGLPRLSGDTLVLAAYPEALVRAGDPSTAVSPDAIRRLRSTFHQIAARWTSAYPQSSGTKEALAISLQFQGDASARDSMLSAARLSTDPARRLHLLAAATIIQVMFAPAPDAQVLAQAARAADSILSANPTPTQPEATALAPLAALVGRCEGTANLLRAAATPLVMSDAHVGADVVGHAHVRLAYAHLGCPIPPGIPSLAQMSDRVAAPNVARATQLAVEYGLFGQTVRATYPLDAHWVRRLAPVGDYLLEAQKQYLDGRPDSSRRILARITRERALTVGAVEPETALPEAELLLLLGDTTAAIAALESSLVTLKNAEPHQPEHAANSVVRLAAVGRAMFRLGDLLTDRRPLDGRRWMAAADALWGRNGSP